MYLTRAAIALVLATSSAYASGMEGGVAISASTGILWVSNTVNATFQGDGSQLTGITYPQNVSITNLSVSDTAALKKITSTDVIMMNSSTLPTCNAAAAGQTRRATNKSCYCNGTSWQNVAPPSAFLAILGINILVADGCP